MNREVLDELGLGSMIDEPEDKGRSRFQIEINMEWTGRNINFNIPKNVDFSFQLIFEHGNSDRHLRYKIANELSYSEGGGEGKGGYVAIYLPVKTAVKINDNSRDQIKKTI